MSIIQEALKKVQRYPEKKDEEWQPPVRAADEKTFTDISYSPSERVSPAKIFFKEHKRPLLTALIALCLVAAAFFILTNLPSKAASDKVSMKVGAVALNETDMESVKTIIDERVGERFVRTPYIPPNISPARPQDPVFILNGIMFLESGSRAIINGSVVEKGDAISGATVEAIERERVFLKYKDEKIMLRLK